MNCLKIQRTLHFFDSPAWHTVGVNHRRPDIGMAEKHLDRADVVICLKQVRGKRVAKGVGGDAFRELRPPDGLVKRQLDVCFMKMIPPQLLSIRHVGQRLLRKKPLPDEILCGFRIFFFRVDLRETRLCSLPQDPHREVFLLPQTVPLTPA